MKYLAALFALFPALCFAGTVSVSWVAPSATENGQPIDTVQSYTIHMAKDNVDLTPIIIPGDQTGHDITGVDPGIYSLYMTATANDMQSKPSQVVSFTVEKVTSAPNPPSITIQFNGFSAEGLEAK